MANPIFSMSDVTLDYRSPAFFEDLPVVYREYGMCLILNVVKKEKCREIASEIVTSFESLETGLDHTQPETWIPYNLPPQTKPGLYQATMSHLPCIWEMRCSKKLRRIYEVLYSDLRGREITSLVPSIDGINIHPNVVPNKRPDWPHVDQTRGTSRGASGGEDIFKCVQGQLVLTKSTACFRCSPKSHHIHEFGLDLEGIEPKDTSNWCKFQPEHYDELKEKIEELGGAWQIPILPPGKETTAPGSFIIWSSTLIHSARNSIRVEKPTLADPFAGWRMVLYITYRPAEEFTAAELKKIAGYIASNRVMNHWNKRVFQKAPGGRFQPKRSDEVNALIKNPEKVFELLEIDEEILVGCFKLLVLSRKSSLISFCRERQKEIQIQSLSHRAFEDLDIKF